MNDGDGIRTTVFMAGCPLQCAWCANPEAMTADEKIGWYHRTCTGCGRCAEVCPQGIGIDLNASRERCTACGRCADVCPTEARSRLVRTMTADEVMAELRQDMMVYRQSGGGVTFSGGDPLRQRDFVGALVDELYDHCISVDMETELACDFDAVRDILEKLDLLFVDIKSMDPAVHRRFTGADNDLILANIRRLAELPDVRKVIRVPVISGVNANADGIRAAAAFLREHLPEAQMELLPYHSLGSVKYDALGLPQPPDWFAAPDAETLAALEDLIRAEGIEVVSFK